MICYDNDMIAYDTYNAST